MERQDVENGPLFAPIDRSPSSTPLFAFCSFDLCDPVRGTGTQAVDGAQD